MTQSLDDRTILVELRRKHALRAEIPDEDILSAWRRLLTDPRIDQILGSPYSEHSEFMRYLNTK